MSDKSKIRRDDETGYPKYDKFKDYGSKHTHEWGGYSRSGENTMKVDMVKILAMNLKEKLVEVLKRVEGIKI